MAYDSGQAIPYPLAFSDIKVFTFEKTEKIASGRFISAQNQQL